MDTIRTVIHVREIELRRFNPGNIDDRNRDVRIRYMMKNIDKDKLKILLQKREKETQKKIEISNLLKMYIECMTDIFYRYKEDSKNKKAYHSEIKNLVTYTNEYFEKIAKSYNCKVYSIENK